MPRFPHRPLAALAALTLLGVPSIAQAAPKIDPQARAIVDDMATAQLALNSLKATVEVQDSGNGTNGEQTITLAFQKPDRVRASLADATGPVVQYNSDGKELTVYAIRDKQFSRQSAPSGPAVIADVLSQTRTLLPVFLARPASLTILLVQPGVRLAMADPDVVEGVAVDVVTVEPRVPAGQPRITLTLAVGHKDHLLRRLTESLAISHAGPKTMLFQSAMHTETVTSLKADARLTARDFTWTAPKGVTKFVQAAQPPMHDPRLKPGARPFPVAATDLKGQPISLDQYKGRVVLMDFWATWCGPCVGEMPNVIAAYKKYHAQGFDIVGISLDQSRPDLAAFLQKNQMPWRQVFDGKGWTSAVPREYGVSAIPFGLLLGRDGKIAAVDVRGDALPAAIQAALAKK